MQTLDSTLYQPAYLASLFDRIVGEYWINDAFSFRLTHRWRRKAAANLNLRPGDTVADLMCGTGENWRHILPLIGEQGKLHALDFSTGMLDKAQKRANKSPLHDLYLHRANVLRSPLETESQDAVICSFGLKTLQPNQIKILAEEIKRILKPGGRFALVELTLPFQTFPRKLHQFHFHSCMRPVARLLGLDEEPLEMLDTYLHQFDPPEKIAVLLAESGMQVQTQSLFNGFACILSGQKIR